MVADGIINIYNMLSAIVALKQVGVSDEKINEALKKTTSPCERTEPNCLF